MSTKTDQVILYLTAMWQGLNATTLNGVQVVDGPQVNLDASQEWLFVGFDGDTPNNQNESATAQQDLMAFARTKHEQAEVLCSAIVVRGDTDVVTARQRAYAIVSAAEDAVRSDMQLGGAVMHAYVSAHHYFPVQTTSGAKVRVVFNITYEAQI